MNPKSECKITYDGYYQWGGVHFQNKGSNELDVNTLPLLDENTIVNQMENHWLTITSRGI